MALNKAYLTCDRTASGDEVMTPYYAVEPLLEFLPKTNANGEKNIYWCPFDENWSAFYNTLKNNGYSVVRSSLAEGQDFFSYIPDKWDIIVSNPPFSKKDKILARLYSLNKPFAVLLPINSIQGKKRHKIFGGDIQMLVFDSRVDYHINGDFVNIAKGNHFGSAYFCRDLLPNNLVLRYLHKYEKPLEKTTEN